MSLQLNLRGHPKGTNDEMTTKTPPLLIYSIIFVSESQGALLEAHALNKEVMSQMLCGKFKEISEVIGELVHGVFQLVKYRL